MKKILLLFVFLIGFAASAQNQMQQQAIQTFQSDYNNNDFEKIYQSFSVQMKQAKPKSYFLGVFSKLKNDRGNLRSVEITQYSEKKTKSKAVYLGHFDYGSATIEVTMNAQNQIIGFYVLKEKLL